MKPLILLPRKTIDSDLILYVIKITRHYLFAKRMPFMTTKMFEKWAIDAFFSDIEKIRNMYDYEGPAVLIHNVLY